MNAKVQRVLCCLLALVLTVSLFSAIPAAAAEPATIASESRSGAVQVQQPANAQLIAATSYQLVPGVTETQVILNQKEKEAQVAGFLATIAPDADVAFRASYAGYYTEDSTAASRKEAAKDLKWNLQTTTKQAAAYEAATGENVIFATNGDYYNMQTAQPLGYLIMEGNVIQGRGEPYFAVLKDGSYALRDAGADCSDVQEAISGPFFLVRGGQIVVSAEDTALMPRNSIGLKADGTVVYITPTLKDCIEVAQTGVEIVAIDGTRRERPDQRTLAETIAEFKQEYPEVLIMADCGSAGDALAAQEAGADLIGTTLVGYSGERPKTPGVDWEAVDEILAQADRPVIVEGRVHTPEVAAEAMRRGAWSVVVGTAITHPATITGWFADAVANAT